MFFLNPVLDNQSLSVRKWLLLWITGYFSPSTLLAVMHLHTWQLELTESITIALKDYTFLVRPLEYRKKGRKISVSSLVIHRCGNDTFHLYGCLDSCIMKMRGHKWNALWSCRPGDHFCCNSVCLLTLPKWLHPPILCNFRFIAPIGPLIILQSAFSVHDIYNHLLHELS